MVVGAVLLSTLGLYLNSRYCAFAKEIKTYSYGVDEFYFWGPKYCPATWSFRSIDAEEVRNYDASEDLTIMSREEDAELEAALSDKYINYNVYIAGDGNEQFNIYESECEKCKN